MRRNSLSAIPPRAMTPVNISSAFRKTGIFPFNKFIFKEEDFMPSAVTDRENPLDEAKTPLAESSSEQNCQDSEPVDEPLSLAETSASKDQPLNIYTPSATPSVEKCDKTFVSPSIF